MTFAPGGRSTRTRTSRDPYSFSIGGIQSSGCSIASIASLKFFGTGGDLITDTVVLGGSLLNNLTFGLAHVISSEFSGSTIANGLMGLCKAGQLKYSLSVALKFRAGFVPGRYPYSSADPEE